MLSITVPSSKPGKVHTIRKVTRDVWVCDCPDHLYRAKGQPYVCKHIAKLASSLAVFASATPAKSKAAEAAIISALD